VISGLYAKYVDALAADRGVLAFFKWFFLGILLQIVFMLPSLPLLVVATMLEGAAGKYLAVASFLIAFAAARVFLFALPCSAVAERKGLGFGWVWGAGGLIFGQIVLGVAAALPSKASAAE
jgi:hypothetical protein